MLGGGGKTSDRRQNSHFKLVRFAFSMCPLVYRVLVGHTDGNPNVIEVIAVGSDGIEGFVPNVDESQVMYGLRE